MNLVRKISIYLRGKMTRNKKENKEVTKK